MKHSGKRVTVTIRPQTFTFSLSLMDPFPRIDIFVRVSSCSLFNEFPRGPRSLPTKLNCNRKQKSMNQSASVFQTKRNNISHVCSSTLSHVYENYYLLFCFVINADGFLSCLVHGLQCLVRVFIYNYKH